MDTPYYTYQFRVMYVDTDQMSVMHHGAYIRYLEMGRTDLMRDCGLVYKTLEEEGIISPVVSLEIQYIAPLRYDEEVHMQVSLDYSGGNKIHFHYQLIGEQGKKTTQAKVTLAFLKKAGERLSEQEKGKLLEMLKKYIPS